MADDLGATGCADPRVLERLPNIKSLFLDTGLCFDHAYGETPVCCPGRAGFLTGLHTRNHGVVRNSVLLLDPSHTIATVLDAAGYYTIHAGKYLNGASALADKTPPGWDHSAMFNWRPQDATPFRWWVDDVEVFDVGYPDRFTMTKSLEWVASAPADAPVFLWANATAAHTAVGIPSEPYVEPQYDGDPRCTGIAPWKPPTYNYPEHPDGFPLFDTCEAMLTVDEMVGGLRATFAAAGRDPIWVFTSDNGMAWGQKGHVLKMEPEAGRLPYYMAGPGVAHGSTAALVSNIDISPTLAALAGTSMGAVDGVSFDASLDGVTAARTWMLEDHPRWKWKGIRTPDWHLISRLRPDGTYRHTLFHTVQDPWEQTNLKSRRTRVARMLRSMYPW